MCIRDRESLSYQFCVQKCLLPPGNLLPSNYEEAFSYIKPYLVKSLCFHACPRDCVLFRDTHNFKYSTLVKCLKCGSDCYLSRNIARKHFLHLPLGPCFGRLYGTASLAQVVQSFGTNEKDRTQLQPDIMDDIQQSPLWNTFRSSARDRTIFLQSSTDGMNPFNKNKTSYSMWPTTLAMLNLPRQIRCDLSRENIPRKIRLNGRVRGKLTGDSRLVKTLSRLKRTIERLQNFMERVSSRAQRT